MRPYLIAMLGCALSFNAFAQRGGGHGGGGGHFGGGGGHASAGLSRSISGGSVASRGFRGGLGASRGAYRAGSVYRGYGNRGHGYRGYGYRGRAYYPGFYGGWPYWWGLGFYDSDWLFDDYSYPDNSNYYSPNYSNPAPYYDSGYGYNSEPVIVNIANPMYPPAPPPPPPQTTPPEPPSQQQSYVPPQNRQTQSTLYLIALNDHKIYPALSYWVEHNILHYVTTDHAMRQVPLSSVDRSMSEELNGERHVSFRLPPMM